MRSSRRAGVASEEVRHVILTHLHADHAGATSFPTAARGSRTPGITSTRPTGRTSREHRTSDDFTGRFAMAGLRGAGPARPRSLGPRGPPRSLSPARTRAYARTSGGAAGRRRGHDAPGGGPAPHASPGLASDLAIEPRRGRGARGTATGHLDREGPSRAVDGLRVAFRAPVRTREGRGLGLALRRPRSDRFG